MSFLCFDWQMSTSGDVRWHKTAVKSAVKLARRTNFLLSLYHYCIKEWIDTSVVHWSLFLIGIGFLNMFLLACQKSYILTCQLSMCFKWIHIYRENFRLEATEAQRYHCKYNFTAVSIILPPRDLFYCREFYFIAASFILLPRVLFYCREFCFTAASFIFTTATLIFTTASFILPPRVLFSR